jgi:uncharacterized membrane protein (DUF2068 family)
MRKPSKYSFSRTKRGNKRSASGLRIVAIFECVKGVLVLLAGFELLTFVHKDLHLAAVRLVEQLHLNPARHYPRIFLDLSERISDSQLWALASAALLYCIVRLVEATGLWLGKKWAEWFGVLTGGMYIPVEIYEVTRGLTWPRIIVLAVNIGVVSYLLFVLRKNSEYGRR